MKTKAALALSITGILLTGSAALAAGPQTLSNSPTGISDDVKELHVPDDSATRSPAPSPTGVVSEAVPPGDDNGGPLSVETPQTAPAGDDKGGQRKTPEPGDDKGGQHKAPEPGDDKGGLHKTPEPGEDSGGHGGHGRNH